jgi:two-component system response regulator DevR
VDAAGGIRVMVVDDHQLVAQALAEVLDDEPDLEVVARTGSVAEATRAAQVLAPDVVLMDYQLPDGNGVTAAERIRRHRPETKVVMLTAYAEDALLVAAVEAGCSGYLTKDRAVEEVVSAVRAAHAGEVLVSPAKLAQLLPKLRPQRAPSSSEGGVSLTARELEVLQLMAEGLSNHAIAERLVLSLNTVRNHVQNVISKFDAHSKLEAVAIAVRTGVIHHS